jgi:hypothetical protein
MLNTLTDSINFRVVDSTVLVDGATIRVGNQAMDFQGGNIRFSEMVNFGGDASSYQNSVLFIQNIGGQADMTAATSSTEDSLVELEYPVLPTDATNPYSPVYPVGQFTFYSSDGTQTSLISYNKVL